MEKEQRTRLQKATQDARRLLEEEFRSQLLQTYDIDVDKVRWADEPGAHLQAEQRLIREKLIAWIEHKEAQINDRKEALLLALREMAFTALNRFVALKLMEARELVRPCVSGALESAGFLEFTAVAQGLLADQESSYRLYLETIFEDVSRELRALFDPRDPASLLWPKRAALLELLDILNRPELGELWREDETLGWVYQYFNGDAERKKMREESAAPRNSRELAVRNQFFTPRYVVEFLTDNTLGRIWYEMRQGNTGLKDRCRYLVRRPNEIWLQPGEVPPAEVVADETLSQEELLRQPVHIPHRELKDPREIRMLDPACGSMHFGLYAFDLYLKIYSEAWEIAQVFDEQDKQREDFAAFVSYTADFASKAAFLREVPRLILRHNIHGIDIDPRATQIARLTLWLRAQRAWQEQQLDVVDRPAITRSNVVCAEPMPGEDELLADFVDQQFSQAERGLVQQLLETIFVKMKLAGEAGSLLKIEEEIRDAIDQARREWQKLAIQQRDLFSGPELAAMGRVGSALNIDLQNLTKDFWVNIEERIYAALRDYAEQVEASDGIQRRLFADDAAQGFAFIDICRKAYDAVTMNPPYGELSKHIVSHLIQVYAEGRHDAYAVFVEMASLRCAKRGLIGALTSRTFLFNERFIALRSETLTHTLQVLADLGYGVLDAMVDVAAFVYAAIPESQSTRIPCVELLATEDKGALLQSSIASFSSGRTEPCNYYPAREGLRQLPESVLCYYVTPSLENLFKRLRHLAPDTALVFKGLITGDDFCYLRTTWEASPLSIGDNREWEWFHKGGEYSPYYSDVHLLVGWNSDGAQLKADAAIKYGSATRTIKNESCFRKPGLGYSVLGKEFAVKAIPAGAVFGDVGPVIQPAQADNSAYLLGFLNSELVRVLLRVRQVGERGRFAWTSNLIEQIPVPFHANASVAQAALELAKLFQALCATEETSPLFNGVLVSSGNKIASLGEALVRSNHLLEDNLAQAASLQQRIDLAIYADAGISPADLKSFTDRLVDAGNPTSCYQSLVADYKNEFYQRMVSWMAGMAFGRWDILCAIGEQKALELPDPFAPLPVCPPGQLQNVQGLPARPEELSASYPVRIPWDGILVDDSNHPLDLEYSLREVIKIICSGKDGSSTAKSIEHEACEILGVQTLRDYFRKPAGFFSDHLKRYSKSRRQAPIYWQLSAGNGNYSAWLYYHRFTQDTLYRVLRDFVEPRIQQAEREQFELESQGALSGDAAARLQEAQTLLQDLRILKSELDLVAPLWNPNLNDGVIINHAILWRITPYTPWQKKCKECWDKLVKGDYDWAHLAFHLWPERVIRKCTTDRSLAIAHGLEERLWQETNNGNWLPRQLSETDLQALIAEHSNPAVKSALERFLDASPPVAPTRTRASRNTRASGNSAMRRPRGTAAVVDAEATRQVLLALTAAPSDGLAKAAIADLIGVEANALTAVIKQLKESGQIDQLGERRGARYVLSEQGRAAVASETEVEA